MAQASFPVRDYDLAATLTSGQCFRWRHLNGEWAGVIGRRRVLLHSDGISIVARAFPTAADWTWLAEYLQIDVNLEAVLATFPDDPPLQAAVSACRGLRLLRQEPWECLASFILSSTKQIVQIQQIIALLCERFGEPIRAPSPGGTAFSFPSPERLASVPEKELRSCKTGFRAPYLLAAARSIRDGALRLDRLGQLPLAAARTELLRLPGVGRKIADCVLLFAYGFQGAFPVDVWVMKALRELYFTKRRPTAKRLRHFCDTHFGPNAGYAQQYLFHYVRNQVRAKSRKALTLALSRQTGAGRTIDPPNES